MASLVLLSGPLAGARIPLKQSLTFGRSPACDVVLDDVKVSRRHAMVRTINGRTVVSDLGSRNGTWLNGSKVEGESVFLRGDRLQVGQTLIACEEELPVSLSDRPASVEGAIPCGFLSPGMFSEKATAFFRQILTSTSGHVNLLSQAARGFRDCLDAEVAALVLGDANNITSAYVCGASHLEIPSNLVQRAMDQQESVWSSTHLVALLRSSTGAPYGFLCFCTSTQIDESISGLVEEMGSLLSEAVARAAAWETELVGSDILLGGSKAFRLCLAAVRESSSLKSGVLLSGELGTGKSTLGRYLHRLSAVNVWPICQLDACNLRTAEESLLGREAKPGQVPFPGIFQRNQAATLLLKNVHLLDEKLASILQDRLRASRSTQSGERTFNLIATSRFSLSDLKKRFPAAGELLVSENVSEIAVPPLRERSTDILMLMNRFSEQFARPHGLEPHRLSREASKRLEGYVWPGNLFELKALAEKLTMAFAGKEVTEMQLPPEFHTSRFDRQELKLGARLSSVEREAIIGALKQAKGKKIRAASLLGISRPTLDKKIAELRIDLKELKQ